MTIRNNHININNNNKLISSVSSALNEFRRAFYYVNYKWFHGHLSGKDAEKLLTLNGGGGKNGSFLIRNSQSNPGDFVLSVRVDDDKVSHVMIRNTADNKYDIGNGDKFNTLAELIKYYKKYPMVETNGNVLYLKQSYNNNNNNKIIQSKMMKNQQQPSDDDDDDDNNNDNESNSFWKTFNHQEHEYHRGFSNSNKNEGARPENRCKNRYRNILPFDETRVKLKQDLDYINANYIQWKMDGSNGQMSNHYNGRKKYIATQGCLQSTIADFWQMVWQENCQIIVMTTKLMERGVNKCMQYWPDFSNNEEKYGKILVKNRHEIVNQYYTIRELLISNVDDDINQVGNRIVYHFHFTAWPDHGVPTEATHILNYLNEINRRHEQLKYENNQEFAIIVHCSAGIGRTGTLIVIDMILDQLKTYPENILKLNMKKTIEEIIQMIRKQRAGMVQTEAQFKFIQSTVQCFIDEKVKSVESKSDYAQIRSNSTVGNHNNNNDILSSSVVILRHSDHNNNNNNINKSPIRAFSDIPLPRPPNTTKPKSLYETLTIGSNLYPSRSPPPPPPPRRKPST